MSFFSKPKPKRVVKRKKAKSSRLEWEKDSVLQKEMEDIVASLDMLHVNAKRVFCYRTSGSKARAYARIWSFPKIFQEVLLIEPAYVMEIISEKFDRLATDDKKKVIIHELLHIPKNFSGALLPHSYGHTRIEREVDVLFKKYVNSK
jgi:predicted metallopeptidase